MTTGVRIRTRSSRGATALATGSVIATLIGTALMVRNGQPLIGSFNLDLIVVGTVYAVVGAFLIIRVPGNRMGWVFLVAALLWSAALVLTGVSWYGTVTAPGSVAWAGLATWASTWIWTPGTSLLLFWVPLLFPDGRLPSRRWQPIAVLGVIVTVIDLIGRALAAWPFRDQVATVVSNFDGSTAPGLGGFLSTIGDTSTFLLLPIVAIPALVVRYRSSRGIARQKMRWFLLAFVVFFVLFVGDVIVGQVAPAALGLLTGIGLGLIPVALAVAILRYRLYEIDRIISRTASWAVVSAILAVVFVSGLVALEGLLAGVTQGQTLAVAGSTLAAFALFQPIRRRVQRTVDRRFNRTRYDAQRTADAFGVRLRDEVDLDAVASELRLAAGRTVAPTSATVWLRSSVSSVSSNSLIS